jgi:hypothetical protein
MGLLVRFLLACSDAQAPVDPVRCLDDEERATLGAHLVALDAARALLGEQAGAARAVGAVVLPLAGMVGVAPVGLEPACGDGSVSRGAACGGGACWRAACTAEGWEARAEPFSRQVDPGEDGAFESAVASAVVRWDAEEGGIPGWPSPSRVSFTVESEERRGEARWDMAQRGVLQRGHLAVAEGYAALRPGHVITLRATFPPEGGAVGELRVDEAPLEEVVGHALTRSPRSSCRGGGR